MTTRDYRSSILRQWPVFLPRLTAATLLACACSHGPDGTGRRARTLLNVSYDATRGLYQQVDPAFESQWLAATGEHLTVEQSHGGSGKQARAVLSGLEADVVTLGLALDVDELHDRGDLLPSDWQSRFPDHSCPYVSTIVFVVRPGNPKHIRDWADLARPDVSVITPNPKTSGGARWNYLAAWGWALEKWGGDPERAKEFVAALYRRVPVLDSGSRGSSTTFAERGMGDVLIAWESEALLMRSTLGGSQVEVIWPPASILAEPPVAIVARYARAHGNADLAAAYLAYLYSPDGQEIGALNFLRPQDPGVLARHRDLFPSLHLFTVDRLFGGWKRAQAVHFSEGGTFDQIYQVQP